MQDAERIVQAQLDAYNARDAVRLAAIYADDAQLYAWPATPTVHGTAAITARYATRFADPDVHARLLSRMVMGDTVVDHEIVRMRFEDGPGDVEMLCIYEVAHGRIARATFKTGPRVTKA
ncbi:MAG TPA: nuclear transport factor 2 family protein [Burkholderiaceae bacterium]